MEARKTFYTFGEILQKIQSDPENLAMTREKYFKDGIYFKDQIPSIGENGVISPSTARLVAKDKSGEVAIWYPSQEDLHAMNWLLLKKVKKDEPISSDKQDSDDPTDLMDLWGELLKKLTEIEQRMSKMYRDDE